MTDGQYLFVILGAETAVIAAAWWTWKHIQRRRARTEWIRQLENHQKRKRRRAA